MRALAVLLAAALLSACVMRPFCGEVRDKHGLRCELSYSVKF